MKDVTQISKSSITNLTMIEITKVSSKGQIVIPQNIRQKLSLKTGSKCILRQVGKKIILIPHDDFEKEMDLLEKEKRGWDVVSEKSLQKLWNNKKDEAEWSKYL
ncbi:MAG: AbrB/MazE/SpoVT family DNA-binding domain-containing protein [Candidatus Woesearchaeota archaeon]